MRCISNGFRFFYVALLCTTACEVSSDLVSLGDDRSAADGGGRPAAGQGGARDAGNGGTTNAAGEGGAGNVSAVDGGGAEDSAGGEADAGPIAPGCPASPLRLGADPLIDWANIDLACGNEPCQLFTWGMVPATGQQGPWIFAADILDSAPNDMVGPYYMHLGASGPSQPRVLGEGEPVAIGGLHASGDYAAVMSLEKIYRLVEPTPTLVATPSVAIDDWMASAPDGVLVGGNIMLDAYTSRGFLSKYLSTGDLAWSISVREDETRDGSTNSIIASVDAQGDVYWLVHLWDLASGGTTSLVKLTPSAERLWTVIAYKIQELMAMPRGGVIAVRAGPTVQRIVADGSEAWTWKGPHDDSESAKIELAVDRSENVYVAYGNHGDVVTVWKVSSDGAGCLFAEWPDPYYAQWHGYTYPQAAVIDGDRLYIAANERQIDVVNLR